MRSCSATSYGRVLVRFAEVRFVVILRRVSKTEVDLQLRHPVREIAVMPWIAVGQPVDTNLDAGAAHPILGRYPAAEL